MIYPANDILLIAAIMTFGSIVQGAVAFASGMICVPLLVLSGFSLPEAATINLISTGVQNFIGAWKLRSHLEPSELAFPVVMRWLAIPGGTYVAFLADQHLAPAQIKQLIGFFLLGVVALLWGCKITPREYLHKGWQALAFLTSGFLMGFASIGGAPMVVYVNSLTWSSNKSRAFLFFCSASSLPIAMAAFWFDHGQKIYAAALSTVCVLPIIFAGLWLGLKLGQRLSKPLFRRVTFALLVLIAAGSIVAPLMASISE